MMVPQNETSVLACAGRSLVPVRNGTRYVMHVCSVMRASAFQITIADLCFIDNG